MIYTKLAWARTNTVRLDEEVQITQRLVQILNPLIYSPPDIEHQVKMAQCSKYKLVSTSIGRPPRKGERHINSFSGDVIHLQFNNAFGRVAKHDPLLSKLTLAFKQEKPDEKPSGPDVFWSSIAAWDVTTWKGESKHLSRDAMGRNLWDAYYLLIYD